MATILNSRLDESGSSQAGMGLPLTYGQPHFFAYGVPTMKPWSVTAQLPIIRWVRLLQLVQQAD